MTREEKRELYAMIRGIVASCYDVAYDGDGWVRYLAERWPDGYCTFHAFEFTGTEIEAYRRAEKELGLQGNYEYKEAYNVAWNHATNVLGLDKEDTDESSTTVSRTTPGPTSAGDYCAT